MNIWCKVAAGIIGGVLIVASLGGFNKSSNQNNTNGDCTNTCPPEDILDGVRQTPQPIRNTQETRVERFRADAERNLREVQNGFSKFQNITCNLYVILDAVVKMLSGGRQSNINYSSTSVIF